MDTIEWFDNPKGFGLRKRDGKRTWIFQYKFGNQTRRIKLGGPELTEARARKLAESEKGKVSEAKLGHGVDPAAVRDRLKAEAKPQAKSGKRLAAAIPLYFDAKRDSFAAATVEQKELYLNDYWSALHDRPLADITRTDVAESLTVMATKNGPVTANRARSALSSLFVWAIGEGWCDNNPVIGSNKRDENGPRERSLSDAEVAKVWLHTGDDAFGRILKLLLLTGCRRTEIGDLKWSEIDLEARTITLPGTRTKNGQQHVVPLCEDAVAILSSIERRAGRDHVFGRNRNGGFCIWARCKTALDNVLALEPWTIHDLRRTVRTGLGELGIAPHIAEAVINHMPPKLVRTYDRNKYESEKRDALDKWATHLKVAIAQTTGANVTPIRPSG